MTSSTTYNSFISNKACLKEWERCWRSHESINADPPRDALFSLIPVNEAARGVVLAECNREKAVQIKSPSNDRMIGFTVVRRPHDRHGQMESIGRSQGCFRIPDSAEISSLHAGFSINLTSGVPLITDYSSKCYTHVGNEKSDNDGKPYVAYSHQLNGKRRKAVLLPHINTMIVLGTPRKELYMWRTFWHVNQWPLKRQEPTKASMDLTLRPTLSIKDDPTVIIKRAKKLAKDPKPPLKAHLKVVQLGKGDYGSVYKAVDLNNGNLVAVKVQLDTKSIEAKIQDENMTSAAGKHYWKTLERGFQAEITALAQLEHTHIIQFHGWWQFSDRVEIYLDLKDGAAAKLTKPGVVPEHRRRGVAFDLLKDVANALIYLHDMRFVHRDIWPENILYEHYKSSLSGYRFFLGDMGHCKPLGSSLDHPVQWNVAHELWTSPTEDYPHGTESDIWGLFTTVVDMLSPTHFSLARTRKDIFNKVIEARENFPEVQEFYDMARTIPQQRPLAKEVYRLTQKPGVRDRFCCREPALWHGKHPPKP